MIGVDGRPGVQQPAQLLVEGDPLAQPRQVVGVGAGEVPLDAEVAEQRDPGAEVEGVAPVGGVGEAGADVGAHELQRDQGVGPALDAVALQGVDAVGDPDPVGALEDLQVHASAAGGAGLDLDVRVAAAQFVHEPVHGVRLVVDAGAAVGLVPGLDEVAVVVPLEIGDGVGGEEVVQTFQDVPVRLRPGQVQDLLRAGRAGQPAAGGHDPVRVGAGEVGVLVDHLGLDPDPELHAEPGHVVGQRAEALGPHLVRHVPVAQAAAVVAARAEPAVVQDEPLGADRRRRVGQAAQAGEVMVEVDGFPGVDDHRPGSGGVVRAGAQVAVEAGRDLVQPVAVRAVLPGGGVGGAGGEQDLAGQQEFARAEQRDGVEGAFGEGAVVAGPGGVHGPDAPGTVAEAGGAGREQVRRVVSGAAGAVLAHAQAVGERCALRAAFAEVMAREVEEFRRVRRHRQGQVHRVEGERGGAAVGHRGALAHQALRGEFDGEFQTEAGGRVLRLHQEPGAAVRSAVLLPGAGDAEGRGEVRAAAVADQAGGAQPAGGLLRQDGDVDGPVDGEADGLRPGGQAQCGQRLAVQRAEVGAPVHHAGQRGAGEVEHEADPGAAQVGRMLVGEGGG